MASKPTYTASADVLAAKQALANAESSKPAAYQSNYNDTINSLLDNILNKEKFSYDFNADPIYQQYKDKYTQQGKQAMADTVSQAASLTGGYGNSYGVTAGSQAYQQSLQNLNDVIPELYNTALSKYQMDTQDQYNQLSAVGTQEDREYGQYRDTVGDYQSDRSYYLNKYDTYYNQDYGQYRDNVSDFYTDRNFDYQQSRDSVSDSQYAEQLALQKAQDASNLAYNQSRDSVSDSQWQQQFNYQKEQDAASLALQKAKAASSGSSKSSNGTDKLTSTQSSTLKAKANSSYTELESYLSTLIDSGYDADYLYNYAETQLGIDIEALATDAAKQAKEESKSSSAPTTYNEAIEKGLSENILTNAQFSVLKLNGAASVDNINSYKDYLALMYQNSKKGVFNNK